MIINDHNLFSICCGQVEEYTRKSGNLMGEKWRLFKHGEKTYKSYRQAIANGYKPKET